MSSSHQPALRNLHFVTAKTEDRCVGCFQRVVETLEQRFTKHKTQRQEPLAFFIRYPSD